MASLHDWTKPTLDSLYTDFRDELVSLRTDAAKMFDNGSGGVLTTNLPDGVIRWNSSTNQFQILDSSSWEQLPQNTTSEYGINVNKLDNLTGSEYVNVASTQNISGAKTFTSNVEIQGTTTLKGDTTLGDSVLDDITVNGKFKNTTFKGDVTLEGANTDLSVGGNVDIDGTLNVDSTVTFGQNLTVTSNLAVNGNTTLGNASSDTITLTGTVGATTFNGDVHLSGTNTDLDIDGTLNVDGAATFNGAVTLGNAASDTILINGDIHGASNQVDIKDAVVMSSTLSVASASDFNGDITTRAITMDNDYNFTAGSNGNNNGDFRWYTEDTGQYFKVDGGTGNVTMYGINSSFTTHGYFTAAGASSYPLYVENDGRLKVTNTADATSLSDTNVSLDVSGGTTISKNLYVGGTIYESSARELKENIQPIMGALGKVLKLEGVSYDKKANGQHEIGLIADDVQEVIPEVVSSKDGKAEALHYSRLTAVLVEAVKELTCEVESLKAQLQRS